MKIISIVGARPQFIKVKPIIDEFKKKKDINHILIHTGQHYDYEMSKIFFDELNIPRPDYNLRVGSCYHGKQVGMMLEKVEKVLLKKKPDLTIVYGDTNSTLAGALASSKLGIPVAHIEAGLRSYRREMPEEINRLLTDHVSSLLFCPTDTAVRNLKKEGIKKGVFLVGDVMLDIFKKSQNLLKSRKILFDLNIESKEYLLLTIHRQENVDSRENLEKIITILSDSKKKIIFPIHPRTKETLKKLGLSNLSNFLFIKPTGYLDMLFLEKNAEKIITDSGGVQKEAYWFRIPCITLRKETEWIETVRKGLNIVTGINKRNISRALAKKYKQQTLLSKDIIGKGYATRSIASIIYELYNKGKILLIYAVMGLLA